MVMEGVKLRPRAKGPPEGELSCLGQLWMTHPNDHFGSRSQTGPPADHLRISPTPEHPHDTPDSEDKTKSNCLHCCRACQIADLAVNDSSRARKGTRTHARTCTLAIPQGAKPVKNWSSLRPVPTGPGRRGGKKKRSCSTVPGTQSTKLIVNLPSLATVS